MGAENKALESSPNTVMLDIPTRLQWQNGHGFCGQTCIQTCSLYYGNYISQGLVRKISGGEILLGQNAEQTIKRLGYQIQEWDNNRPQPQYQDYLQWIKRHIKNGCPVIICGYDPEGQNDQYDHIYLAVGFNSANLNEYSDQDQLIYMDLYDQNYTVTKFGKVWGVKGMKDNDKDLAFAIPKNVNYGIAILGVQDPEEQFLPITVKLNQKSQPNVSIGKQSKQFNLNVVVQELEKGKTYALLRYDSFKVLPKKKVVQNQATSVKKFVAQSETYQLSDQVQSSSCVFYRCVEEQNLE